MQPNEPLKYSACLWFLLLSFCLNSSSLAQDSITKLNSNGIEENNQSLGSEVSIPSQLHIFSPLGEPISISTRTATVEEIEFLLRSNESGEPERIENYWAENPTAYYRWDLNSGGDSGIISDIFKEVGILVASGEKFSEDILPRVVTARINNEERIIAFGTYLGEVKFHSDSQLRKQGYKGMGTAIVADYLSWCLKNEINGSFTSVNNSYGFYEKLGFKYKTPDRTPGIENPSIESFDMELPLEEIPKALRDLYIEDSKKLRTCENIF